MSEEFISYGRDATGQHLTVKTDDLTDVALLKLADKLTERVQARQHLRARAFKETLSEISRSVDVADSRWRELLGNPLYEALLRIDRKVAQEDYIEF